MSLFAFIKRIYKEYPIAFTGVILMMTVVGIFEGIGMSMIVPLLNLVFMGKGYIQTGSDNKITDIFIQISRTFNFNITLINVLIVIFSIFLFQSIIRLTQDLVVSKLITKFHGSLIGKLYKSYFDASWPYFLKSKVGNLVNNITLECERAEGALQFLIKMLSDIFISLFYIAIVLFISWKLTIGGIILGVFSSLFLKGLIHRAERYGMATTEINNALQSEVGEKLSSAKIIKASVTEKRANELLKKIVDEKLKYRFKSLMNSAFVIAYYLPVVIGIVCIAIYVSLTYLALDFSVIVLFLLIFYRLMPKFSSIQSNYHQTILFIPGLAEIDRTLHESSLYNEKDGEIEFDLLSQFIEFKNVSFSYNGKDDRLPVLKNINLYFKKGTMTAIVGGSGAGKTTVVDLVLGLIKPNEGAILVDGKLLESLNKESWRKSIGYVSQDIFLFNDTIRNNISWVCPNASFEQMEKAAKVSYAHEFIIDLPEEYNTIVGDRGVKLSGGQKQRIALARAMLQNPQILILDEATSALDSESEKKIQTTIEELAGKITIIIISHRLSTVKNSDYIYVLEGGKIIESGTWAELTSSKSRFQQLKELQVLE
jgi:ABC-type multidrug transport system fused ATPase/permease subunit